MAFRFRRTLKIAPGLRANIGKRGISLSSGARGASVNVGRRGPTATIGAPGTGASYTTSLRSRGGRSAAAAGGAPVNWLLVVGGAFVMMLAALFGQVMFWVGGGLVILAMFGFRFRKRDAPPTEEAP